MFEVPLSVTLLLVATAFGSGWYCALLVAELRIDAAAYRAWLRRQGLVVGTLPPAHAEWGWYRGGVRYVLPDELAARDVPFAVGDALQQDYPSRRRAEYALRRAFDRARASGWDPNAPPAV